jgi:phospholipid/cholesterol/gamma-HCH transport system permease protein
MSRAAISTPSQRPAKLPFVAAVRYLGGVGLLGCAVLRAILRPRRGLVPATWRQLVEVIGGALGIVLLVHFSMGSFLSMQAFFGATFREAAGAVVGVGLVRNLATLLTGFVLAALLAARAAEWADPAEEGWSEPTAEPDGRIAARILGAALAGPVLACWGAAIGMLSGMLVSRSLLGIAPGLFVGRFAEMARLTDALGIVVKGAGFAAVAALIAEHEGRRGRAGLGPVSARRAVLLSIAGIVFLNGVWFSLAYLSGNPFGPALELR